jgi:hypothetical protein
MIEIIPFTEVYYPRELQSKNKKIPEGSNTEPFFVFLQFTQMPIFNL